MAKSKNLFKRFSAFLLAMIMTFSVDLPMGASGIWSLFDFVKATEAAVRPSKEVTTTEPKGSGTSSDPYQLNSVETLYWFVDYVNAGNTSACASLTCDIMVNSEALDSDNGKSVHTATDEGVYLKSIGTADYKYNGTFDGQGFTIRGLYQPYNNSDTYNNVGLFAYTDTNALISNLNVSASYMNGYKYFGGICANNYGTIKNCTYGSSYMGARDTSGSICGINYGTIENCTVNQGNYIYTSADLNDINVGCVCGVNNGIIKNCTNNRNYLSKTNGVTHENFGGICGKNTGTIDGCKNTKVIRDDYSESKYIGGICGYNVNGTITDCTNSGSVYGCNETGGICGYNEYGSILNCSNSGVVRMPGETSTKSDCQSHGGICGFSLNKEVKVNTTYIKNCYNTADVIGEKNVGGICGKQNIGSTIFKCYNTGKISGRSYLGGICGTSLYPSVINNCYNTGSITGDNTYPEDCINVGGIAGYNGNIIQQCYNNSTVIGTNNVGGITGYNYIKLYICYYNTDKFSGNGAGVAGTDFTVTDYSYGKSTKNFNQGEIAYYLQRNQSEIIWGQKLGTDDFPVFSNDVVYYNDDMGYHNHGSTACDKCDMVEEVDGVYQIKTKKDLIWFAQKVNNSERTELNAELLNDIDMEGAVVTPIGCGSDNAFTGVFNGKYHTIKNYVVTTDGVYDNGLFGYVDGGTIMHLTVYSTLQLNFNNSSNSNSGHAHSGFAAHLCNNAQLKNCRVHTDIQILSPGNYNRVGIVAANAQDGAKITSCKAYGSITSTADEFMLTNAGGVVGRLSNATVVGSHNYAEITLNNKMSNSTNASISSLGGVVGCSSGSNTIDSCSNNEGITITATDTNVKNIGGIVGYAEGDSATSGILKCSNTGSVNINATRSKSSVANNVSYIGGIIGSNDSGTSMDITLCKNYGNINISGNTTAIPSDCIVYAKYVGGIAGGTPKATNILKCINTGNITLTDVRPDQHGGIVGYCGYGVALSIESSGNAGNIICQSKLITPDASWGSSGGILGYINNSSSSSFKGINNCYNVGTITSYLSKKGGVIGHFNGSLTAMPQGCTNYYLLQDGVNGINGTDISNMANLTVKSEDILNGELCYMLNNGITDGTQIWYQTLESDLYPVFQGETVYYVYNENTAQYEYSNEGCEVHNYINGICERCKSCQVPELETPPSASTIVSQCYAIYNAGNLIWFAQSINKGYDTGLAMLKNNISLEGISFTPIGTSDYPFTGTFYGAGYTITFDQTNGENGGLFGYVDSATINSVNVDGTINADTKYVGGIANRVISNGKLSMYKCISQVNIVSTVNGDGTHGGFIGVADGNVGMYTCAFRNGSISGEKTNSCGGFIGWANGTVEIDNSYMASDLSGIDSTNGNTFVRYNNATVTLDNCYYIDEHNTTPSGATKLTKEEFKNGKACYLLNSGNTIKNIKWYQTVVANSYPNISGKVVFRSYRENTVTNKYDEVYYNKGTGDVNLDGVIDEKDLTLVLKYLNGVITFDTIEENIVKTSIRRSNVNMTDAISIANEIN